jgi:hypothetical protein
LKEKAREKASNAYSNVKSIGGSLFSRVASYVPPQYAEKMGYLKEE